MRGKLLNLLARKAPSLGQALRAMPAAPQPGSLAWGLGQQRHAGDEAGSGEAQQPAAEPAPPAAADTTAGAAAGAAAAAPEAAAAAARPAAETSVAAGAPAAAAPKPAKQQKAKPKPKKPAQQNVAAGAAGKPAAPRAGGSSGPPPEASPSQAGLLVGSLLEVPPLTYFDVPAGVLPEASHDYYKDPILRGENVNEPNFGCKAVQQEFEHSGRRSLMARDCMHALARRMLEPRGRQLYLEGWAGSGKSVALYSLVAWARANGYLALYIPSAFSLVQSGTFSRGEDGLWDTPEAARWILSSLRDSHAAQLADLALTAPSGEPLTELLERGLDAATPPAAAVAAAVAAKEAVAAATQVPTLLAVDDYNVLYSHTGYYEAVHSFHRRQLAPDELRLVRAFRLLEQPPPANGVAVAAPTLGQTVSARLRLPLPRGSRVAVPRYSPIEVAAMAEYFVRKVSTGAASMPSEPELLRALALTNGNAKELRQLSPGLFLGGDLLGLSQGHKAAAAQRRADDVAAVA